MRRLPLILTVISVALAGLAACSSGTNGSAGGTSSIKGVTVSGAFGAEPTVTVNGLDQTITKSATLIAGTGQTATAGSQVFVNIYLANGNTGKKAASTWDQKKPAQVPLNDSTGLKQFVDAVVGQKVGSRILLVAPATDIWPETGNPQLGINPGDSAVFVIDLVSVLLDGPSGTTQTVPSDLPVPIVSGGKVTGIDFSKAPKKPGDKLQVVTLIKGNGKPVAQGSTVAFNYYGVVYGGTKPFDESYDRGPATFQVGVGSLIKAWDQGLVGVPEGSRVLIIAPPSYGYGSKGTSGIPGGSTLVFVVDVLGVA